MMFSVSVNNMDTANQRAEFAQFSPRLRCYAVI